MSIQDAFTVVEVPVVPEVAAVLERTRQRLSSEAVTEVVSRAGFGTELDRLMGRLTDIYLAVLPAAGLPDRAERYWFKEIEDACYLSDRFVDLVREFPYGSHDDGLSSTEVDYDVDCALKTLLHIFGNLLERPEVCAAESEILGREEDKENIFQIIIPGRSDGRSDVRISDTAPPFFHISGSDGSGKTALARLVYNDPRVKKYFDCRMWVAVPEDFDVELIAMKIIKCAIRSGNRMLDLGSVDKLYDYLRGVLRGRKFFLVLDDVRSVNYDGWRLLRFLLSVGEEGSTIITTVNGGEGTNKMIAESGVPYMLEPLPEDVCFDLLVKKAFGTETEVDLTAFSEIGKKIVRKCRGLPLAVNMIGGMLRCNPENRNHLLESLDSHSNGDLDLHTLTKFSYETLPSHLQWCITYLTLFPYDYAFDKHKIVELWNAEGFILCAHQDDIIEDYCGHLFDTLVSYSFLQAVQYPCDQVKYRVNRYLYYAEHPSMENFVICHSRLTRLFPPSETIRLLSLLCDEETRTLPSDLSQCRNLRTLLLVKNSKMDELKKKIRIARINDDLFTHLANLCVLDLNSCAISELPKSINRLSCLRYLNLSETDIETIPESIGNLRELQILNLSHCKNFHTIPESIGGLQNMLILNLSHCKELCTLHPSITKLRNLETLNLEGCCKLDSWPERMYSLTELRYLNILGCSSLTTMPRRMRWLSRLQTLSRFIVTTERGLRIEELGSLDNLKGALQIENLEKALDPEDAKRAELNSKRNITSLALYWSWLNFYNADNEASDRTAQQVLEALQPPSSLEKLDIFSYPGTEAPRWMTNGKSILEYMVEIRLVNLKRLESLPPLGQFPCLKVIEIRGMDAVTCVDDDTFSGNDGTFPKLEKLTFSQMPKLQKWEMEDNRNKFPCLIDLTVAQCPKLKALRFSCSSLVNLNLLFNQEMLYSTPGALKYFGRSLRKLTIGLCCELVETSTCKALHDLIALEALEISECDELISLSEGMRHLTSLRCLTITNCRKLKTLPDWLWNSASRPELFISGCPKLHRQI